MAVQFNLDPTVSLTKANGGGGGGGGRSSYDELYSTFL